MKQGCIFLLVVLGLAIAGEFWLLDKLNIEAAWYIPVLLGFSVAILIANLQGFTMILKYWRASKVQVRDAKDGMLIAVTGRATPSGSPLVSPFGDKSCVIYEYNMRHNVRTDNSNSRISGFCGMGMTACNIQSPQGTVRLVGFPLMQNFPMSYYDSESALDKAAKWLAETEWKQGATSVTGALAELRDILNDEDGVLKVDLINKGSKIELMSKESNPSTDSDHSHAESEDFKSASSPIDYYRNAILDTNLTFEENFVENGAIITGIGTYQSNPPRLNIGSGFKNIYHSLHPGPFSKVIKSLIIKTVFMVTLFTAIALVGHWRAYAPDKPFDQWLNDIYQLKDLLQTA